MIPTILFLLLRRYGRTNPVLAGKLAGIVGKTGRIVLLFLLLILGFHFTLPSH
jgi:hypothetical protein